MTTSSEWFPAVRVPALRGGPVSCVAVRSPTATASSGCTSIEKPIATSAREAEEIAAAARSAGVFAAEAMWTRYLPQFDVLDQLLQRGDLGTIRLATAEVGWAIGADPPARMLDPGLAGGAALDMGVYGYWFAQFAIGRPQAIRAVGSMTGTGVDEQAVVAIAGAGGAARRGHDQHGRDRLRARRDPRHARQRAVPRPVRVPRPLRRRGRGRPARVGGHQRAHGARRAGLADDRDRARTSTRDGPTPRSTASTTRSASCTRSMPCVPNSKASRDDQ